MEIKYLIILFFLALAYNISAYDTGKNKEITSNLYTRNITLYNSNPNNYFYSNTLYRFADITYSYDTKKRHNANLEMLGLSFALNKFAYIGFSTFEIKLNENITRMSFFELSGHIKLFNILNDHNDNIAYDFLNLRFRPISTTYRHDQNFRYSPHITLGNEIAFKKSKYTLLICTNYNYNFYISDERFFELKIGYRAGDLSIFPF